MKKVLSLRICRGILMLKLERATTHKRELQRRLIKVTTQLTAGENKL